MTKKCNKHNDLIITCKIEPKILPVNSVNGENAILDGGHVVIFQEEDAVGVLDDGAGVARKEVLHGVAVRGVDLLSVTLRHPGQ